MQQNETKQLLKILKRKSDRKINPEDNDVLEFLKFYNIKAGRVWVNRKNFWALYKKWTSYPIEIKKFYLTMANLVPTSVSKGYRVNLSSIQMSEMLKETLVQEKNKVIVRKRNLDNFLSYYEIESGKNFIKASFLHDVFIKWCNKHRNAELSREKFDQMLKLILPSRYTTELELYIGINIDPRQILSTLTRKKRIKTNENEENPPKPS